VETGNGIISPKKPAEVSSIKHCSIKDYNILNHCSGIFVVE
jgi:hypothetical protein